MDTKNTPDVTFETHAINLLLATPTAFGRAFVTGDEQRIKDAAAALPLTTDGRIEAVARAGALFATAGVAAAAKVFQDALKEIAYAGSEPHPEPLQAVAIVEAMKALDAAAAAEKIRKMPVFREGTTGKDK
jgi:hypothetical protein